MPGVRFQVVVRSVWRLRSCPAGGRHLLACVCKVLEASRELTRGELKVDWIAGKTALNETVDLYFEAAQGALGEILESIQGIAVDQWGKQH